MMIGITAIFAFMGLCLGFVGGAWWGFNQNWLIGIPASAGGAVAGGIIGYIAGFLSQEIPESLRKLSKTHRVLGGILTCAFWLLYISGIVAFWCAGTAFIRYMHHHY
jgi:hypothetical protein